MSGAIPAGGICLSSGGIQGLHGEEGIGAQSRATPNALSAADFERQLVTLTMPYLFWNFSTRFSDVRKHIPIPS